MEMVPGVGLEPTRLAPYAPQTYVSANSTSPATESGEIECLLSLAGGEKSTYTKKAGSCGWVTSSARTQGMFDTLPSRGVYSE